MRGSCRQYPCGGGSRGERNRTNFERFVSATRGKTGVSMKVAYFGLPLGALLLAADGHALSPVVLAPVPAPGRRRLLARLGAERLCAEADVDGRLAFEQPELLVSWFWTRRLPERWLTAPRLGGIGVHPSLLPRHRGPNPFFWAIDSGDALTGVSVHRLTPEYDRGDVLAQETLAVGERDAWQLARALDRPSLRALRATVARLAGGETVAGVAQDELLATWAPEPDGDLLRVDWSWPTERVLRRIRALAPVPGLALEIHELPFFVTRASACADVPAPLLPGEALVASGGVSIRTGDGSVRLDQAVIDDGREVDGPGLSALLAARRSRTESPRMR